MSNSATDRLIFSETDPTGHYHIHGSRLWLLRAAWVAVTLGTVVAYVVAIAGQFPIVPDPNLPLTDGLRSVGITPMVVAAMPTAMSILAALVFAVHGVMLFFEKPDNWLAIVTSLMLTTFGLSVASGDALLFAATHPEWAPLAWVITVIGNALFGYYIYTLPDGKFYPRWTVYIVAFWTVFSAIFYGSLLFVETPALGGASFELPTAYFVLSVGMYGFSMYIQQYRNDNSYSPTQKQQVKLIVAGLIVALVGYIVYYLPGVLFPVLHSNTVAGVMYNMLGIIVVTLAVIAIPLGIRFSIIQYGLWDIDFYLSRSVLYAVLTVLLGLLFVGDMLLFQRLFQAATGTQNSPVALAIAALISGLLFQPVRGRMRRYLDKRLFGIHIEYDSKPEKPSTNPRLQSLVGGQIGPYRVDELVGRGGMAEVYRGFQPSLNRMVALKLLTARMAEDEGFRRRFEREAQTIASLNHPNIIQVFDYGESDGIYYMAMEYIAGNDLGDYITRRGLLGWDETLPIVEDIAAALDFAHTQALVHRDVKPSNVMLHPVTDASTEGRPTRAVLMDFGIAKMITGGTRITQSGMLGTLDYIAPEQIQQSATVDGRADVYSLGIMTYQMLTGRLPFKGDNPGAVLLAHMQQPAPDPRKLEPSVPEQAAYVIRRAMAKDPTDRFATAGEMVAALQPVYA